VAPERRDPDGAGLGAATSPRNGAFFLGRVYRGEPVRLADYAHIPRFAFVDDPRPAWSPAVRSGLLALLGAVMVSGLVAMQRVWRAPWPN
jgi:hypothetical protein